MDDLVVKYHALMADLNSINQISSSENNTVIQVAKLLRQTILSQAPQMSWPPKEIELQAENVQNFIPPLLDTLCSTLMTGKHGTEIGEGKTQRKNSIAQDTIYSVSNGRLLTPKSVLFPAVVKSLCNNTEVLRMPNKLGHGISYDLVQEIETEHALYVINEKRANKVVIPEEDMINSADNDIAVMIADNIDNLERTVTGFGTSHRVNSILVTKKVEDNVDESEITSPAKRKCLPSIPDD